MRQVRLRRVSWIAVAVLVVGVAVAAPARAALPRTYQVQTIRAPNLDAPAAVEGHFGVALVNAGRGYVIDGATGAVLKRLDMPDADLVDQAGKTGPPKPAFGRTILSPAGLPPCAGNMGIGACASLPNAVKIGDMDGGGTP